MSIDKDITERIYNYENPPRVAFSRRYPFLKKPIIFLRHRIRDFQNFFDFKLKVKKRNDYLKFIVARHQSVLRRRLGDSNPKLQEQKITNLKQAIKSLDGIVIEPGNIFSFWDIVGRPTHRNGYIDGMLLSGGRVVEGMGGGLCQLSNFLYWIFLHAPTEQIERHHHSMDVFPDSGRTLPFGSGATILYNFIDLKIKNVSSHPIQLKLWLTDNHLKGQILSPVQIPQKYHVFEKNHCFIRKGKQYFRYNEIYREIKIEGEVQGIEKIITNFAPVLYKVTKEYLEKNNFEILDLSNEK
jgi:vancomycin resistance protein VanW